MEDNDNNTHEPWWIRFFKTFGLPTALCVAMCIGWYRSAQWIAENVVKPVVHKHIEFLEELKKSIKLQEDVLRVTNETMNKNQEILLKILDSKENRSIKSTNQHTNQT